MFAQIKYSYFLRSFQLSSSKLPVAGMWTEPEPGQVNQFAKAHEMNQCWSWIKAGVIIIEQNNIYKVILEFDMLKNKQINHLPPTCLKKGVGYLFSHKLSPSLQYN